MWLLLALIVLASAVLPGWLSLALLALWLLRDGYVTVSQLADERCRAVAWESAGPSFMSAFAGTPYRPNKVPWSGRQVTAYVVGVLELVAAAGLGVWSGVLLW